MGLTSFFSAIFSKPLDTRLTGLTCHQWSTGNATIDLTGTGANGTSDNLGVRVSQSNISSLNGNITVNGTGGGTGDSNHGIVVDAGIIQSTESANITLNGTGGSTGNSFNYGVQVHQANSSIRSVNGNINVTGTGGGTGGFNRGIVLETGGQIQSTGNATITLNGTGSGIAGDGIRVDGSGSLIQSNSGVINLTGTGSGTGFGINILSGGAISSTTGNINLLAKDIYIDNTTAISTSGDVSVNIDTDAVVGVTQLGATVNVTAASLLLNDTIKFDYNNSVSRFDTINLTGSINLNGSSLQVDLTNYTPSTNLVSTLISNDDTDTVTGTFTGLAEGALVGTKDGYNIFITYQGNADNPSIANIGSGNDVQLYAIINDITIAKDDGLITVAANFIAPVTNPFGLADVGSYSNPEFVDIDNDGDLDAFIARNGGDVLYFQNTGSSSAPSFTAPTINPFGLTTQPVSFVNYPGFVDIDNDGDLDAFLGQNYFENIGTASSPSFAAPVVNAFGLDNNENFYDNPKFVDIDNDGDLDAFLGGQVAQTFYFENIGTANSPSFAASLINPFGITAIGVASSPDLIDIDNDGDFDAFLGAADGRIFYFENIGTATSPSFAAPRNNNFGFLASPTGASSPEFVDIDNDGDLDAFVGGFDGNTLYFENNPFVADPAFTTNENTAFTTGNVLANDSDLGGDILTVVSVDTTGTLGTVINNGDGTFSYDPNGAFESLKNGQKATDIFTYTISDGNGGTDTATVTITINGVNDAPVGSSTATLNATDEDTAVIISAADLLAGFSDVDGDTLSVVGLTANNGTLVNNNNGTYTFTPNDNFNGTVTLSYGVSDGIETLTGQTTSFSVTPVNDPLIAEDDGLIAGDPSFAASQPNPFGLIPLGGFLSPTFVDINGDGDLDAFVGAFDGNTSFFENTGSATSPSFAAAQTNPFGLTSVAGFSNPTFVDIDGDGDLDAFVGAGDGNTSFFQNTGSATSPSFAAAQTNPFNLTDVGDLSSPTFADIDGDGDLDAFVGANDGNTRFFENTGSATSPSFAAAQINPFNLTDVGDFSNPTFVDINGDGNIDAFVGAIDGINFFQNLAIPGFTTNEDTIFTTPNVLSNDSGDLLTVVSINTTGTLGLVTNNGDGTFSYNPNRAFRSLSAGETATDTFTYTISDGNGGTDTATVTITINGVDNGLNSVPTGSPTAILSATAEDIAVTINAADLLAGFSDVDGDTLSVVGLTADSGNLVDNLDGTYTFTPNANFNGNVILSYGVSDGIETFTGQTTSFSVTSVNDVATGSPTAILSATAEDTAVIISAADLLAGFSDVDGDTLSVVGLTADSGNLVDNLDGTYTFTPNANFNGNVILSYGVSDGIETLTSQTTSFSVTSVNDVATIAGIATAAVIEDAATTLTATGSLTVADVDTGESVFKTLVTPVGTTLGSLSITDAGIYSYSVDNSAVQYLGVGQTKTETFTVESFDGTASQNIVVTINGVNDAPIAVNNSGVGFSTNEDSIFTTANVLTNDTDVDNGDILTITSFNTTGTLGLVTNNGNGTFSYNPNNKFESLNNGETATDSFSYTVSDGKGGTNTETVSININGVTDVPVLTQISAESLTNLTGYVIENNSAAQGGSMLSLNGTSSNEGTATFNFNGLSGLYHVIIGTFDENDGQSTFTAIFM